MKHLIALLIKFAVITVVTEVVLGLFTNLNFTQILYMSASVTVLSYIIGDLVILPSSNNSVATIADLGLVLLVLYSFNYIWWYRQVSFIDALVTSIAIGVGEWFFHKYVGDKILHRYKGNNI